MTFNEPLYPFTVPDATSESHDPYRIISRFYRCGSALFDILWTHSCSVTSLALSIADAVPKLDVDRRFLYEGAMLHDIGIFMVNAPGICCLGQEPYVRHGYLGGTLLRNMKLERHALICERHTGSGITHQEIEAQHLPLPLDRSYMPESVEERLVCYADLFYSKSHLDEVRSIEQVRASMQHFGEESMARLEDLIEQFHAYTPSL